jgi:simple sugar transport system substrate-binding protein
VSEHDIREHADDIMGDAVERLEWDETKAEKKGGKPVSKAAQITRRTALTGGAAGLAAVLLEACGGGGTKTSTAATSSSAASSIFGVNKKFKYVMVNHVTTNTFFTPTQSGAADACKLLGCSYTWTGSETSNVGQMVNAFNTAISAKADGIATSLIDPTAFNTPVNNALSAGIPVVSYNADEPNARLAYVGQDLFLAGQEMGAKIKALIPGGGNIAVFIATPGSANIQPRLNGIIAALKGSNVKLVPAQGSASGAAEAQENTTIKAFVASHMTSYKGYFAVDAGSTSAVSQAIQSAGLKGKVAGGGFDLTPITESGLAAGYIQFTIDQQPYLQGFLPILELYFYNVSQGLTGPADVNTGLKFLDQSTVHPYVTTKSKYEGTGTKPGVQKS